MAEKIGRLGYIGIAIEAAPGTPEVTPDIFIPFTENTMRGHHEPIFDTAARGSRVNDYGSVGGKRWGEGSITMYLDSLNSGYLIKMALGAESRTVKTASINDHLMTPTVSGNAIVAATLWDYKGFDVEQYSYAGVDVCEIEITNDGIATINASIMSKAPAVVTAPTLTTASGTLYTWKNANVYFGDIVQTLDQGTPTKITNFKCTISNNLELTYKTGSQSPDTIVTKQMEVTGSYTLYFENATDRDRYYNLTKKSMLIRLVGGGLGSGFTEQLDLLFNRITIQDIDIETGLNDLFAITATFRAEYNQDQPGYVQAMIRNGKVSDYS